MSVFSACTELQVHACSSTGASMSYSGSADPPYEGGEGVAGILGYYAGWHLAEEAVIFSKVFSFWVGRPAQMAHSYRLGLVTWRYQVRILVGPDIWHRGCAYTVFQTVQRPVVYSAAYDTVHFIEPLKSFEIRVGHSPGFRLPSVAILPWMCRKRSKAKLIYIYISA